ncbi:hypothetical protein [Tissierella sp.]|uniref:hypothetical protein n=1 Tax=Tissierella sp. TaxID=41274 RepID=UPI002865EA13|nr:hypothetical protein [Tissierella sp.]MDR7857069.1 hypothetical protein [Tissierella sp.]
MIKRLNGEKRYFGFSNKYYNKLLNRIVFILFTLLIILIIKMVNNTTTNSIIKIIEKNIYYDFSLKEDGNKIKDYLIKAVDNSKDTLEELNLKINKNSQ